VEAGPRRYVGNSLVIDGWRLADGYAGLVPHLTTLQAPITQQSLRLANVRWVHRVGANREISGLEKVTSSWSEVAQPLARVRFVTEARASDDVAMELQKIDPATTALTRRHIPLPEGRPGMVLIQREDPGYLELSVELTTDQLLIVAERYHRGWRAEVDGLERAVMPVYEDYLGCVVPAGSRHVVLEFAPSSLRVGKQITRLFGVLYLVWVVLQSCWPRRRSMRKGFPSSF
jgi:hypothetical protein